jgi:hypothetical protein
MSTDIINVTLVEEEPINAHIESAQPVNIEIQGYSLVNELEIREAVEEIIADLLHREDLTAQVDGITEEFITTTSFYTGSIKVWLNGLKERGVIEVSSSIFKIVPSPEVGDTVEVEYLKKE